MFVLKGPEQPVLALAFSPDATTLYASHVAAGGVTVFDLAARASRVLEAGGAPALGEVAVHPGGRWLFGSRRGPAASFALDLPNRTAKLLNAVNPWDQLAVSPNGQRLATIGSSMPTRTKTHGFGLFGWTMTVAGPRHAWEWKPPNEVLPWVVAFVGNDTFVTEDRLPPKYSEAHSGYRPATRLALRSATDGKLLTTFDSPYEGYETRHLFAPPDGRCLVARRGLALHVWDATDWGKPPVVVPGKEDKPGSNLLRATAFHPSAPYLLRANDGPSVTALDTATWKETRRWNWKAGVLRAVAVSPDGTLAAAGGPRGTIVLWDLDL